VGRSVIGADAAVRSFMHAEARSFMHQMVSTLLELSPEAGKCAYDQLRGQVDALADGKEVRIYRFQLPPGHPMAAPHGGHPCDSLELGADNVLRAVTTKYGGPQGF
jgi:hypothetical protein